MKSTRRIVFETERLQIRLAGEEDVDHFYRLWTNPQVMVQVGFPNGLKITPKEIQERLAGAGESEFEHVLVVDLKSTGCPIGEAWMTRPDSDQIAVTDVKLLPEYWGNRYGIEIKRGLLDHLFTHTNCLAVEASPNVNNLASIKMQAAVGGVCLGDTVYQFPAAMQSYTTAVHAYIYRVDRQTWEKRRQK
ncbi:MAG: GNAT family N-acetyltransferase [Anaerolineales bacterium]|jgi:RimJ/RimL family protein N-acetyltransferase|nr:GNAT family N-acetyltransferase [Anaerolineales bacterium]